MSLGSEERGQMVGFSSPSASARSRGMDTDLYIFLIDAGEDALRSEDVGPDGFSRLDAQKELLLGSVRSTLTQHCNNVDNLLLYTLGEETYHKANVAIIVTARGRASVALPPTCSAIEFYSCLRDLSTTGGETNFAGALGLASLLAHKAGSPRIIGFIAGDLNSSMLSPSSNSNKDAESLAVTLSSRVESLPLHGSELTLISFASPRELDTPALHSLELSLGKEKIRWVHSKGNKESGCDNYSQFLMDLKLCIGDEAGIPSFIASKSTPEQELNEETTPPVTTASTSSTRKVDFQKSGPLQRSSFTCRDSSLDVLLHHSRSGLLRSKMPTYSTLAAKASQGQSANNIGMKSGSRGSGSSEFLSTPHGCYIRIMPQPKYRTLLTFKGALMVSRGGYETAPVQIATKLAAMTATISRQLVQPSTNGTSSVGRGKTRPCKLGRGPLGVIKILQNMNHPEMLLLTWMPSGKIESSSGKLKPKSSPPRTANNEVPPSSPVTADLNGSSSATDKKYPIPEPFNMFSGRPPVTLASLIQTLRGRVGTGIESAVQNPFEHDGWEYWAQGHPAPFHYMTVLSRPGGSLSNSSTGASSPSLCSGSSGGGGGVTVVEKTLEIVAANSNSNDRGSTSSSTSSSDLKVYEKGYSLLFNTPHSTTSIAASSSVETGINIVGGGGGGSTCAGITSSGDIPPIWIPTGTTTEEPAEEEEEEDEVQAASIAFEGRFGTRKKAQGTSISVNEKSTPTRASSTTAAEFMPSIVTSIVSIAVFISTFLGLCTLLGVQVVLSVFSNLGKQAARMVLTGAPADDQHPVRSMEGVNDEHGKQAVQNVQETSPPPLRLPSFSPSLEYPLSEDFLLRLKSRQHIENALSSLMMSPPWVSIADVVQSIRDAVASNNNNNNNGTIVGSSGIGKAKEASSTGRGINGANNNTNQEITSAAHPAAIILGPLDPAAVSYLLKLQQAQQQHMLHHHHHQLQQQQKQEVHSRGVNGGTQHVVEEYTQTNSLQHRHQPQTEAATASDTTNRSKSIKAGLNDSAESLDKSATSCGGDTSRPIDIASNSNGITIPLGSRNTSNTARKISITMGESAASGEVAVTVNGRQLPLSSSTSTACLDIDATERASLPIPIPCSNTFVEQDGEDEEEVKMTPPGAVTSSVVAGARANGLEGSAPPPKTDTAE